MSNRPPLNWSAALRDLKGDRATRQPIREERLRTAAGLRGLAALSLSAWRGESGRRYVVAIHSIGAFHPDDATGAVVLFISRDENGASRIVYGARDLAPLQVSGIADLARADGCTEVHVHRLAEAVGERAAILTDLAAPVMQVA